MVDPHCRTSRDVSKSKHTLNYYCVAILYACYAHRSLAKSRKKVTFAFVYETI